MQKHIDFHYFTDANENNDKPISMTHLEIESIIPWSKGIHQSYLVRFTVRNTNKDFIIV